MDFGFQSGVQKIHKNSYIKKIKLIKVTLLFLIKRNNPNSYKANSKEETKTKANKFELSGKLTEALPKKYTST